MPEIWMGGTDSFLGDPLTLDAAGGSHIIDLAGDLPEPYRQQAWRYTPRVFIDLETVPVSYPRLASLVHEIATSVSACSAEQPRRIDILCEHGMNRSGLITGMLLRALGESAESALRLIRVSRPGALSNLTFVSLIEQWVCPLNRPR